MTQVRFPQELAQMGKVPPGATLNEIKELVGELSKKTGAVARAVLNSGVLEEVFDRIDELQETELGLNRKISDLQRELDELQISMDRLEPLAIALRLDLLQEKIFSCPKPATGLLLQNLNVLKDRFDHLHFQYIFPDTEELNPDSFQNNLLYRMEQEITHSDPERADALKGSLSSLQSQCKAAEEIFLGKGLVTYFTLPESVQQEIEGRFFERFPKSSLEILLSEPEGQMQLAAAVMASLADRMMDVDL